MLSVFVVVLSVFVAVFLFVGLIMRVSVLMLSGMVRVMMIVKVMQQEVTLFAAGCLSLLTPAVPAGPGPAPAFVAPGPVSVAAFAVECLKQRLLKAAFVYHYGAAAAAVG